eukprot:Nitzschia sp. Nitz4//scaffold167_size49223//19404//21510//NITZ4_007033-RA/size49223-augustus-gene-0.2-mRNA-1//-1//CDS//3329538269//4150//frame0
MTSPSETSSTITEPTLAAQAITPDAKVPLSQQQQQQQQSLQPSPTHISDSRQAPLAHRSAHYHHPYPAGPHFSRPMPPPRPYDHYYEYPPTHRYAVPPSHPRAYEDPRASPLREVPLTASNPIAPAGLDPFRTGGCTCKKSRCLKLYCQCFSLSTTCGAKCKCQTCHNTPLHAEAIEQSRKTILERNPSAFDDKFRGMPQATAYRGPPLSVHPPAPPTWTRSYAAPPPPPPTYVTPSMSVAASPSSLAAPATPAPRPRVNKYGCKCRKSFCLKKYCECFQNSTSCGLHCKCVNCKNLPKDQGSPPPSTPAVPASLASSPRSVSVEEAPPSKTAVTPDTEAKQAGEGNDKEDRMAIMAAVAMTELFSTKESSGRVSLSSAPVKTDTAESDSQEAATATPPKRKLEDQHNVIEQSPSTETPPAKKARSVDVSPSAGPIPAAESRNPSPVSVMTPQQPVVHRQYSHPPYIHQPRPPPSAVHRGMPRHPVPPYSHHRPYPSTYYSTPPPPPPHSRYAGHHPTRPVPRAYPTSYEEVTKSSGLPKSLSFRKICSKCGKTRGEHGELGFGNKCVFEECGKCGAGIQMHRKVNCPMGILCRLTVEEGATPGAALAYERKIRELAARAELQKTLLEDKRERVERLAAQFVTTN